MMRAFPGQVRRILEWSIQHPREAVTTARRLDAHARRHRRRRQQRTPARVADDAELGASAIAAIKYLSDDRG